MATKGEIKKLVTDRGFGFIKDKAGNEWFFHRSSCPQYDSLREGQKVTFSEGTSPKGPRAEDVTPI